MATFITIIKFTPQGITNLQDTCKRAAAFKAAAKKLGAKVTDTYWTQGPFDGVLIFEAPDDETASAAGRAAVGKARPLSQNGYKTKLASVAVKRALLLATGQTIPDVHTAKTGGAA